MKKKLFVLITGGCCIIVLILFAIHEGASAERTYDLRYALETGAEFGLNMQRIHNKQQDAMGSIVKAQSSDSVQWFFRVAHMDRDGMNLEVTYGKRAHRTSDTRFADPVDFSGLTGRAVRVRISPNGELSAFGGFEDLPAIMIPDENQTLDEPGYKRELENLFTVTAGRPLTIGEEWTHSDEYDVPVQGGTLTVRIMNRYRIVDQTRRNGIDCVRVAGTSEIEGKGQLEISGMPLELTLEGSGEETLFFAHKLGMFVTLESSTVVSGEASSEEMGLKLPFQDEYSTEITVSFDI